MGAVSQVARVNDSSIWRYRCGRRSRMWITSLQSGWVLVQPHNFERMGVECFEHPPGSIEKPYSPQSD
jgi:hypothetical protein